MFLDLLLAFVLVNIIGLFIYLSKTIDKSTLRKDDE
jgi:hypothetical protein